MAALGALRGSLRRIRRTFLDYLKVGVCLVLIYILLKALVTGVGVSLAIQAGVFLGFAVVASAVYASYQEARRVRARQRDTQPR